MYIRIYIISCPQKDFKSKQKNCISVKVLVPIVNKLPEGICKGYFIII